MSKIILQNIATSPNDSIDKSQTQATTKDIINEIEDLQDILIADSSKAILVILQGLDASGKDGVSKNVFGKLNPLGLQIAGFKKPTPIEMAHDFLWRVHQQVPAKGKIGIFNRSHYEDVLIQKVHHWVDDATIQNRYKHINHFEQLLEDTNTTVLKFYLHTSSENQLERLTERKENPKKMWKHNDGDWTEREFRTQYIDAYETVFEKCSEAAPWHIIPADKNWYKEYLIAKKVLETLKNLNLKYPTL
ncbi:MAG: deoxynucleoside kinase [Chitinophagales bacterium]|nr:deoxynucleoside kinase [Chitinophagales bacterium]